MKNQIDTVFAEWQEKYTSLGIIVSEEALTKLKEMLFKSEALAAIKTLRDVINDTPGDPTDWANVVVFHLDAAADALEFPFPKNKNAPGNS